MGQKRLMKRFLKGLKDGIPIALGYLSVSFAFGMLAIQKGMPLWSPVVISITNFTGTGQFAGIDLIEKSAALIEIATALLIINMRYLLMSLSLSQRLTPNMSTFSRILTAFGITDEIFAVAMQQSFLLSGKYMAGLILISYSGWVGGTALGAMASYAIPASVRTALCIAIYAMFIAIIVPPAKKSRPILAVVIISLILSCLLRFLFETLSGGWIIIICGIAASMAGAVICPIPAEEGEEKR